VVVCILSGGNLAIDLLKEIMVNIT
jgi:hypothetical protein